MRLGIGSLLLLLTTVCIVTGAKSKKKPVLGEIKDHKDYKKLLRTKNNVLIVFVGGQMSKSSNLLTILSEVGEAIRGQGTVISVHCDATSDSKKLCKKLKIQIPKSGYLLKHYKDGEFHLDYSRPEKLESLVNFMQDPSGDQPWEEVETSADIRHISDQSQFNKVLKNNKGKVLVMFYAPWCGFCKRMKPDFEKAATDVKSFATLVAVDTTKPKNNVLGKKHNITGFPTLIYFEEGKAQYTYPGDNNREAIVKFLENPSPEEPEKEKEVAWSDIPSDVNHLTQETFDNFLSSHKNVLVMFYAPWCGHCKKMKPGFEAAAAALKEEDIDGKLAAVDCTVESTLATKFGVKGYPTVKFFRSGEFAFDAGHAREKEEIIKFMRDPTEPPPPPPPEKAWSEEESNVLHLTKENFKSSLKRKKNALVMFYAPWCGHCKKAKPEITEAAEELKDNPKATFAAVDCTQERDICDQHEVRGYPTFKFFRYFDREPVRDYDGGRRKSDFVTFMKDPDNPKTGSAPPPPSPEEAWEGLEGADQVKHLTLSNFGSYISKVPNVIVVFYAPWCGHCKAMKADYASAALGFKEDSSVSFGAVDATIESQLAERFDIKGYPTIKIFKNGAFSKDYKGARLKKDFINYMRLESHTKDEL